MPRAYKQRPVTKTNQLVLRLTDETVRQLKEIVASSPFRTSRVAVIEHLIYAAHGKVKKEKRS